MFCISHDGLRTANKEEVWQCPRCFRTITAPIFRDYQPNVFCHCEYPHTVHIMQNLGSRCPVGFVEQKENPLPQHTEKLVETETKTLEEELEAKALLNCRLGNETAACEIGRVVAMLRAARALDTIATEVVRVARKEVQ